MSVLMAKCLAIAVALGVFLGCTNQDARPSTDGPLGGGGAGGGSISDAALGSGGASDAAGDPPPIACSPGESLSFGNSPFATCSGDYCGCDIYAYRAPSMNPDAGSLLLPPSTNTLMEPDIASIHLRTAMQAGQSYAMSNQITDQGYEGRLEIWGSDASCGNGVELLFTDVIATKAYCMTMHPSGSYQYLLVVRIYSNNPSSARSTTTPMFVCPNGSCP